MKIETRTERNERHAKAHDVAEQIRTSMTETQLEQAHGRRHQGEREKARRQRQIAKISKENSEK